MGNLCIVSDDRDYEDYIHKRYRCIKCGDNYTLCKNNNRLHCRFHRVNKNNVCIDCGLYINNGKISNCRHVKKTNWFSYFI